MFTPKAIGQSSVSLLDFQTWRKMGVYPIVRPPEGISTSFGGSSETFTCIVHHIWITHWFWGVSINGGTPKSSISIGISPINHPFWATPIYGHPHWSSGQKNKNKKQSLITLHWALDWADHVVAWYCLHNSGNRSVFHIFFHGSLKQFLIFAILNCKCNMITWS